MNRFFKRNAQKKAEKPDCTALTPKNYELKINSQDILRLNEDDGFEVEYEILQFSAPDWSENSIIRSEIQNSLRVIETRISTTEARIDHLNQEIDRLTNHADYLDYTIAVASGVLSGIIDAVFVGESDFKNSKAWSNRTVNDFIMKTAKRHGFEGERLNRAIASLEKHTVVQDNVWKGKGFSSAKTHHLDDLAHHPSLLGLISSIIAQFFRTGIFVSKDGKWNLVSIETDPSEMIMTWAPIVISGLTLWLVNIAEDHNENTINDDIPAPLKKVVKALAAAPAVISILKCVDNWALHLVSDMGGSSGSASADHDGMGIPGIVLSLLKEISSLPVLKDTGMPQAINNAYTKSKLDLRGELAYAHIATKQMIPVAINEMLVRGLYFVRRLLEEWKNKRNFASVEWERTIPFGNRTIARMMTISTGTLMATDIADAALHGIKDTGGIGPAFFASFALRVNFVGVGRFVIALGTDIGMGIKRQRLENEQISIYIEYVHLANAKMFYKQADMWLSIKETDLAIQDAYHEMILFASYFVNSMRDNELSWVSIQNDLLQLGKNNPGIMDEILEEL